MSETTTATVKAKTAVKATNGKAEPTTIRLRVFQLLNKKPSGGAEVKDKLGLSGIPSLLKDEAICAKPRICRKVEEGRRGVVYHLTALGKKDLVSGKVDENAADSSAGKDWPTNR